MVIRFKKPTPQFFVLLIVVVVLLTGGVWAFRNFQAQDDFKTTLNPQKAREVAESLLETVGKIYVLPNETPTVATVTDKNTLPNNFFYKQAEIGDKILIFANAHKIILYRPSLNKVVDVAEVEEATPTPRQEVSGANSDSTESANFQTVPRVLFNSENN